MRKAVSVGGRVRFGVCLGLVWGAMLFGVAVAEAQTNAETLAEGVTGPGWAAAAKSSLAFSSGNVDLLEVRGEASSHFATPHPEAEEKDARFWFRDRILVYGSAGFKRVSDARVANDGYAHVRYTRMQWLRLGGEIFAQAQYDQFRLLSRRLLAGCGLRAVFAAYEHFAGWVGSGYFAEFEKRNIAPENRPPQGPDRVHVLNHRLNNYLTLTASLGEKKLAVVNTLYAQPRVDAFSDLQLLNESRLQVELAPHLSLTLDVAVLLDTRPPRGVERRDLRIGNGLVLRL